MDINRTTEKVRAALQEAQVLAIRRGHQSIGPEHLVASLCLQDRGLASRFLDAMGVDSRALVAALEAPLSRRPSVTGGGYQPGHVSMDSREIHVSEDPVLGTATDTYVIQTRILLNSRKLIRFHILDLIFLFF